MKITGKIANDHLQNRGKTRKIALKIRENQPELKEIPNLSEVRFKSKDQGFKSSQGESQTPILFNTICQIAKETNL